MTAARPYLSLVPSTAEVIPLPRREYVEHNALRHAVLREAANGIITRDDRHTAINGHPAGPATIAELGVLETSGLIGWFTFGPAADPDAQDGSGHVGWITESGATQLAQWDGPRRGGDAA